MDGMEAVIQEFLDESRENLDQLDQDLVALEENPSDREVFARIFRTVHTIKGTCGFLAFPRLEAVTHAGENVLASLRDGELELDAALTDSLLKMFDRVRELLTEIGASGGEPAGDDTALIAELEAVLANRAAGGQKKKPADEVVSQVDAVAGAGGEVAPPAPATGETSLRVDLRVLDELMNLVGELVLARNQILEHVPATATEGLAAATQRLDSLTGALQDAIMRTRMQPIRSVWSTLPRFVRDLASAADKRVDLELHGQETELDKSVMEAIRGSLLHLVRNAVDHGIEPPAERQARSKPEVARLRLAAAHEGGNVVIELGDDGGGLDHERILQRAVESGLVPADQATGLSREQVEALIFHPGFSTAAEVTEVSGRGVGLDVVKSNVEAMGGSLEVRSDPGRSTSFRLEIPLTLAIIPVLLIRSGGSRYALPQAGVVELVSLNGADGGLGIERLHGVPVFRLRDHLLPLVDLAEQLGDPESAADQRVIVVLENHDRLFGLVVDRVEDSQEIVVKALGDRLAGLPYVGATILGDGGVALILDVAGLGAVAGVIPEAERQRPRGDEEASTVAVDQAQLLVCGGRDDERFAIRLDRVVRLEAVLASRVEQLAGRPVVQYRGAILDLFELEQVLPERRRERRTPLEPDETGAIQVVVCRVDGRTFGVVVHRILDIVGDDLGQVREPSRDGVESCVVLDERVTEVVDLAAVAELAVPGFFARVQTPGGGR